MQCVLRLMPLLAVPSWAQQPLPVHTADTLDNVDVVSSHRVRELESASPQYSLSRENFNRLGVTDISDAIHRLPGITLRDYGGAGGMKTVSVRGLGAQNTGVSYDGIALSDCQTGQIDLQRYTLGNISDLRLAIAGNDDIFLPARNVSSATLLAITTQTENDLASKLHGQASLTLGSWGYTHPLLQMGTSWRERFALSGTASFVYAENDYPFTLTNVQQQVKERRTNSRMNQWHGETNLLFKVNQRNRLTAKLYYYDNNRQLPGMVHYYTNESHEKLHERNAFVQARWLSFCSDRFTLMANGKFNWASSDYDNGTAGGSMGSATYWQREAYASASMLYTPVDWLSLSYAADYQMNNLNGSLTQASRPYRHSVLQALGAKVAVGRFVFLARGLYAIYLNGNKAKSSDGVSSMNPNQTVSGTEPDEANFAPSVSASFQPFANEQLYVRASWKHVFRMPTFNELYYYHLGNPMLSPEQASQYNVGLTWQSGNKSPLRVYLTADAYINNVTDKIVAIPFNMFVWHTVNIGKVRVYGLDATADFSLPLGRDHILGLNGNYSYQRAKNLSFKGKFYGNQIAYTPQHSGSATLYWSNPWLNLSATASGMSSRWATNEHTAGTKIDGFVELSFSAYRDIRIGTQPFTLRASMLNATNLQYDIVRNYPMPGRSWKLAVSTKF